MYFKEDSGKSQLRSRPLKIFLRPKVHFENKNYVYLEIIVTIKVMILNVFL